ncbi:MAG: PEP-CTERM sorting domain-containing protein [Chryseobacterium sp.]
MSKIFKQTSIALLSVVSLLGISRAAVAANFTFKLDGTKSQGSLQFGASRLTGVGSESITLDQIPDVKYYFNFQDYVYTNHNRPVFSFLNGELIGVQATYTTMFKLPILPPGGGPPIAWIFPSVNMNGDTWNLSDNTQFSTKAGTISFQTLEPISSNSVPEPSNALGVFLGLAGILGFKSRLR